VACAGASEAHRQWVAEPHKFGSANPTRWATNINDLRLRAETVRRSPIASDTGLKPFVEFRNTSLADAKRMRTAEGGYRKLPAAGLRGEAPTQTFRSVIAAALDRCDCRCVTPIARWPQCPFGDVAFFVLADVLLSPMPNRAHDS
jgi:hypothetical protein